MKKIYIAGKLNSDAPGYIQNCHAMIKQADEIRRLGFSVFIPFLFVLILKAHGVRKTRLKLQKV